jgi:PIN domain nuclease of toxin-antitoxin system
VPPQLLLDTHVVIRRLVDARRLSREQARAMEAAARRTEPLAISAISLVEIATLVGDGKLRLKLDEFFADLQSHPVFQILPLSYEIATEVALLGVLRDPADRAIVATARVHRLRLVTSDQRIVESKLVPVVD